MITNAHIILIIAGFMRSPSVDLWSPLREEVIHETWTTNTKKKKLENHTNLINLKNSNRPAGHDIGKQTNENPINQNIPHCEQDQN